MGFLEPPLALELMGMCSLCDFEIRNVAAVNVLSDPERDETVQDKEASASVLSGRAKTRLGGYTTQMNSHLLGLPRLMSRKLGGPLRSSTLSHTHVLCR